MLIPQYKLGHSAPPPAHTRCLRRGAGRDAEQAEAGERRQCPVVESSGESSTASVGNLGVAEVEQRQPSHCRRRACRWRRNEGGEAQIAERVAP